MDITKLTNKLQTVKTQLHNPITPTHLYGLGTAVFFTSIFSFLIFIDSYPVLMFWLCEGMILVMAGFIWEAYLFIKKLYQKSFIASAIVSLSTGAITSTLAIVIAEQLINQATHLNPDYFDNSLRIITALSMPLVLVYLVAFCLMAYYLVTILLLPLTSIPTTFLKMLVSGQNQAVTKSASNNVKLVERATAAMFLSILIVFTMDVLPKTFKNQIDIGIKFIVAITDHYQFGPCKNVGNLERFTFINDSQISVFNPYDKSFLIKDCVR